MTRASMDMPWNDRSGRFSALRVASFALVLAPALSTALDAATGGAGAEPLEEAIHRSGTWALRLLLISLAVTPLRRITGWGRWIIVRRMLGLAVFFYAVTHLILYVADQGWDMAHAASEILSRLYLTIGFVSLLGLSLLAASSTDRAIWRMGRNWRRLHGAVYALSALALLHFILQSKVDATEPVLMLGFWLLLMGWRMAHAAGASLASARVLALIAVLAALATGALEAGWYAIATGVPWRAVLEANLQPGHWPRPAWWILAVGVAASALPLARSIAARRSLTAR